MQECVPPVITPTKVNITLVEMSLFCLNGCSENISNSRYVQFLQQYPPDDHYAVWNVSIAPLTNTNKSLKRPINFSKRLGYAF